MMRKRQPEHTSLFFAVLDGDDPRVWKLFGKEFPELMLVARQAAEPYAVPRSLLDQFTIDIQPLLVGPEALLVQKHLDTVVGMIIDAAPKESLPEDFFAKKLDTLRALCRKMGKDSNKLA